MAISCLHQNFNGWKYEKNSRYGNLIKNTVKPLLPGTGYTTMEAMFYYWLQSLLVIFSVLYRIAHTYMYQSFFFMNMLCAVSVCRR